MKSLAETTKDNRLPFKIIDYSSDFRKPIGIIDYPVQNFLFRKPTGIIDYP